MILLFFMNVDYQYFLDPLLKMPKLVDNAKENYFFMTSNIN